MSDVNHMLGGHHSYAPDLIEPVVCVRWFQMSTDPYGLHSVYARHTWGVGEQQALCLRKGQKSVLRYLPSGSVDYVTEPTHDAPDHDCSCGLYGYFDFDLEHQAHHMERFGVDRPWFVPGIVVLYGRMEVHRAGARASQAQLKALGYLEGNEKPVKRIAELWELPVWAAHELHNFAHTFGSPITDDMRPKPEPTMLSPADALLRDIWSASTFTTTASLGGGWNIKLASNDDPANDHIQRGET